MANKKVQKAGKAAQTARSNPYVQRLIEDEELRQNIVQAFESARDAYGRLNNGRSPARQVFEDKKLQKHIRETAGSVRDVSVGLYEAPKKQKSGGGLGTSAAARRRRRRGRARRLRGAAQEGARRAVRCGGGVRVHLDHRLTNTSGYGGLRQSSAEGAHRAPSSFLWCGAMNVFGLCLGGNVFGWTADRDASFAVLDAYVEAGGDFIDTADTYMRPNMGISETIIGEWMAARGNRDSLVIATKVGSRRRAVGGEHRRRTSTASLARLQTDRIDLYYAHKDDGSVPVEETVRAFDALVREGKVLHVAMSNTTGERLAESLELAAREGLARYEWLQPHYNLVEREGYETEFAPVVERYGLDGRALLRAGLRLPHRQVPRRRQRRLPARRARLGLPRRARPAACSPRWTRSPPRTASPVAAVAIAWLLAKPGVTRADRQRPHARAARRRPARRGPCS